MKRFTPDQLGLFDSNLVGHEFFIIKRYAHLYWIPLFPTETFYAVRTPDSSDKYELYDRNILALLEEYEIPVWKQLFSFTLLIAFFIGLLYLAFTN